MENEGPTTLLCRAQRTPVYCLRSPALSTHDLQGRTNAAALRQRLGDDQVRSIDATMTGEDFGRYSRAGGFPGLLLHLGSVNPDTQRVAVANDTPLPSLHSSRYTPDPDPILHTGPRTLSTIALRLLAPR